MNLDEEQLKMMRAKKEELLKSKNIKVDKQPAEEKEAGQIEEKVAGEAKVADDAKGTEET